jgi:pimeloyl-ACP methyl ester carboxylesterase
MRTLRDRQHEKWAFLPSEVRGNTHLALFVHGFWGGYLSTWGRLPDLLTEHADAHQPFSGWDYLFVGFDTGNVKTFLDVAHIICSRWMDAARGALPLNRTYTTLALFGHSLGTLGIRQALCAWSVQPPGMLAALRSVTLFGPPLNGSGLAKYAGWSSDVADALKENNPQLRMLRAWAKGAHQKQPWPEATVVVGLDDKVVGHEQQDLVNWPGDQDPVTTVHLDHRALVKPPDWDNSSIIDYVGRALK